MRGLEAIKKSSDDGRHKNMRETLRGQGKHRGREGRIRVQ